MGLRRQKAKAQPRDENIARDQSPKVVRIHISRRVAITFGLLFPILILGTGAAGVWLGQRARLANGTTSMKSGPAMANAAAAASGSEDLYRAAPGPWGDLECQKTVLEIPDECLKVLSPTAETRWSFPGFTIQN